jgi:hypothetical protein
MSIGRSIVCFLFSTSNHYTPSLNLCKQKKVPKIIDNVTVCSTPILLIFMYYSISHSLDKSNSSITYPDHTGRGS